MRAGVPGGAAAVLAAPGGSDCATSGSSPRSAVSLRGDAGAVGLDGPGVLHAPAPRDNASNAEIGVRLAMRRASLYHY
jgi:hypothetical protein